MTVDMVPGASIAGMVFSLIVSFALPIGLFVYAKKKLGAKTAPFFIGCGVFFVMVLMLEAAKMCIRDRNRFESLQALRLPPQNIRDKTKPASSRQENGRMQASLENIRQKNLPTRGGCKPSVGRMLTSSES